MDPEVDYEVDTEAIEHRLRAYAGRCKLRFSVSNVEAMLRILIGLVAEADSRPDRDFMVGEELLHDFSLREASAIEETLVYKKINHFSLTHLLRSLEQFALEHIDHRNDDTNQRLRATYKRNGLHGMFKAKAVEDLEPTCLMCCDAAPTANYSARCSHDFVGCPACLAKLAKCPVCMQQ